MNKKKLSEGDIITKYIIPAVEAAGWDREKQIRDEVNFTDCRIIAYAANGDGFINLGDRHLIPVS